MNPGEPRPRNRGTMLWLVLLFLAPLGFSFWLYYGSSWRPASTTNNGELITPARPLPQPALATAAGDAAPDKWLEGKWSLLVIGNGACDETCRQSLVYTRQTWLSLGRLSSRVQRVFLASGACCDRDYLAREQEGLLTLDASGPAAATLLAKFPAGDRERMVFIVDPLGNLMMRYDSRQDPKGLRSDLKKLLDLSHIG